MKKVFSLGIVLVCGLTLAACSEGSSSSNNGNTNKATVSDTHKEVSKEKDSSLLKNHDRYSKIATGNGAEDTKIAGEKDYTTNWSDSSWAGVNLSVDKVSILKVTDYKDYSDNVYAGFAIVHFIIDNTEHDINIYPEQATLNTNNGEQTEGSYELDHFGGEIMKGSKVDGYAAYPLKNLDDVNSITQLRLKFNANYITDDYSDSNANHEYDITIDLQ